MIKNIFFIMCLNTVLLWASTEICGVLRAGTTFKLSKSPYLVTGDIWVPANSRLSIEPGVEVILGATGKCDAKFSGVDWADSNYVTLHIDGGFYAKGTPEKPIVFRSPKKNLVWDGIRIKQGDRIRTHIENIIIQNAHRGLSVRNSRFVVTNSIFKNNNIGVYLYSSADVGVFNSVFTENVSAGLYQKNSSPTIAANFFIGNVQHGMWSDSRLGLKIQNNLFFGNGLHDCYHCPSKLGELIEENLAGDSVDQWGNLFKDPVLVGSSKEAEFIKKDIYVDTPINKVKDTVLAMQIMQARKRYENLGINNPKEYKAVGLGKYRLSKYSPALRAAPDHFFFYNRQGERSDIGLFGAYPNRSEHSVPTLPD
jgi:hypothetical protein